MTEKEILKREIQLKKQDLHLIQDGERKVIQRRSPLPLRTIIKEVLVDLYCRGVIPKSVTQKLYNMLGLKHL